MRKRRSRQIQIWSQAIPAAESAIVPAQAAGAAKGAVSRRNQMGRGIAQF
jgi:hypothetical protein